jgi:hypothetical protein
MMCFTFSGTGKRGKKIKKNFTSDDIINDNTNYISTKEKDNTAYGPIHHVFFEFGLRNHTPFPNFSTVQSHTKTLLTDLLTSDTLLFNKKISSTANDTFFSGLA